MVLAQWMWSVIVVTFVHIVLSRMLRYAINMSTYKELHAMRIRIASLERILIFSVIDKPSTMLC